MSLRHKYHQHRFQVVVRFHTGILALTSRIFCKIPKALSHLRCRKTKHTQKKLFGTHATLRTARVALWFLDVSSSRAKTHTHTPPLWDRPTLVPGHMQRSPGVKARRATGEVTEVTGEVPKPSIDVWMSPASMSTGMEHTAIDVDGCPHRTSILVALCSWTLRFALFSNTLARDIMPICLTCISLKCIQFALDHAG